MKKIMLLLLLLPAIIFAQNKVAIFAGGCFWCVQADFDKLRGKGVVETIVGYDGDSIKNPTYNLVSAGKTNYVESVKIIYNTKKISYMDLLDYFWKQIDPTVENAQFCDRGAQYKSAIFYLNEEQRDAALKSLDKVKKKFAKVYTEVLPSTHFYPAESYHQNYYKKNPLKYRFYRFNCGRDQRLKEIWKH